MSRLPIYRDKIYFTKTIFLFSSGDSETTRILSSLFDVLVIFVSFVSIILTMRSILRAQKLRKVRNLHSKVAFAQLFERDEIIPNV